MSKINPKEISMFYEELISLANHQFGPGKWSHAVTSQTLDFLESLLGNYVCGCVSFVKINLCDTVFHEDVGYCYVEDPVKGLAAYTARIGSVSDAFRKVLSCFGESMELQVQQLAKKYEDRMRQQCAQQNVKPMKALAPAQTMREPTEQNKPPSEAGRKLNCSYMQNFVAQSFKCNRRHSRDNIMTGVYKARSMSPIDRYSETMPQPFRARSKSPLTRRQSLSSSKPFSRESRSTNYQQVEGSDLDDLLEQEKNFMTREELEAIDRQKSSRIAEAKYKAMQDQMRQEVESYAKGNAQYY